MPKKSNSYKFKIFLALVFLGLFTLGIFWFGQKEDEAKIFSQLKTSIYSESDFVPLYNTPQNIYYTNSAGEYVSQSRTGYKSLYDLDDSIIRCQQENSICDYPSVTAQMVRASYEINRFKVFIPPGTTSSALYIYLEGQSSKYIAVSRLGQPPVGDYGSLSEDSFGSLPFDGFSSEELISSDCVGSNHAGILTIINDGLMSVTEESGGGWLYVLLIPFKGRVQEHYYSNTRINTEPYLSWFRKAQWDSSGNPIYNISPSLSDSPSLLPGDIEPKSKPDGDVDIYDYSIFIQNWNQPPTNNPADIDKNGKVDIFDYNLLVGNFGKKNN